MSAPHWHQDLPAAGSILGALHLLGQNACRWEGWSSLRDLGLMNRANPLLLGHWCCREPARSQEHAAPRVPSVPRAMPAFLPLPSRALCLLVRLV